MRPNGFARSLLPVLPLKLRTIIIGRVKLMSLDINELYQRFIYHNNTINIHPWEEENLASYYVCL